MISNLDSLVITYHLQPITYYLQPKMKRDLCILLAYLSHKLKGLNSIGNLGIITIEGILEVLNIEKSKSNMRDIEVTISKYILEYDKLTGGYEVVELIKSIDKKIGTLCMECYGLGIVQFHGNNKEMSIITSNDKLSEERKKKFREERNNRVRKWRKKGDRIHNTDGLFSRKEELEEYIKDITQ